MSLSYIKSILSPYSSISDALKVIEATHRRLACVIENKKLIGVITDGDIRRGLLKGYTTNTSVLDIMNKNFIYIQ